MHASARLRIVNGRLGHFVRPLCRLAGIDPRRCFCIRCIAARSGIYHRTRTRVGHRAYVDVHLFGIRIRHCFTFEQPLATPPLSPRATSLNVSGLLGGRDEAFDAPNDDLAPS